MNLARSPRQTYRALLFDYDELVAKSDDECCYSLSEREVQLILAQLDYITWKTRYRPTHSEISREVIDNWQGNLARKLMSGCCPDDGTLGRFGEDGQWEISTDGGETWTPAPEDDPRNDYIGAQPLPGEPGAAKQCAAADNVEAQFLAQRDYIISLLEAGTTLIALVAGILAFLAVIAGIGGATIGISVLLMGMAAGLLTMTPESVEDQIDTAALDTFKCLVYMRMDSNGQLTYGQWLALLVDITNEFDAFPETFFYSTTNAWGYIGMNNAGTIGVTTAADCDHCDDVPPCFQVANFSAGTVMSSVDNMDGSWTFVVNSINNGSGTQYIRWGVIGTPACCCFSDWVVNIPAVPEWYYWACANQTPTPTFVGAWVPDSEVSVIQQVNNAALGTPFSATITIFGECP